MRPLIILDLSYYQNPNAIDYKELCRHISGVIIRVAYGSGAPGRWEGADIEWERHYFEFRKQDMPIGGYHYITEYQPIDAQIEVWHKATEGKILPIAGWADVELENNAEALTKKTVDRYLAGTKSNIKGIYTSMWQWHLIMNCPFYSDYLLWVAHYGATYPFLPQGMNSFWLWQNHGTETGRIPGYARGVDLNLFQDNNRKLYDSWVLGELPSPLPPPKPLVFYAPTHIKWITQKFGVNPQWYSAARGHNGIDYGTPVGTAIYAAMDGVIEISKEQVGGYGRHIRIRHPGGVTIYGHLSKRLVQVGAVVAAKQIIGYSGGAMDDPYCGMSTGPHLHFEYRQNDPVVPLVPGSHVYNAIDTLPFTISWDEPSEELGEMLFQVEVLVPLNVRKGIGTGYGVARTAKKGEILGVYEVTNGWYRISDTLWVSGWHEYSKRIVPAGELSLDQKVEKLWEIHPELYPEK